MKKFILITLVATIIGVVAGVIGVAVYPSTSNTTSNSDKLFGNVQVSEQDIRLCRSAWKNGGKYYIVTGNISLTCIHHHVEVNFNE